MTKNTTSNLVKIVTMNPMNPMYILGTDWVDILQFAAKKAQKAVNTIFCSVLGCKSGSFTYIWFIGAGLTWLLSFLNEPNVDGCRKGCSMRFFALSVFCGWQGLNLTVFKPVFGLSDELEKGPMYIKFIASSLGG
jgi:hypothetical protein